MVTHGAGVADLWPVATLVATPGVGNVATPGHRGQAQASEAAQVDAVIALAMSAERAEYRPPVVHVLGWIG